MKTKCRHAVLCKGRVEEQNSDDDEGLYILYHWCKRICISTNNISFAHLYLFWHKFCYSNYFTIIINPWSYSYLFLTQSLLVRLPARPPVRLCGFQPISSRQYSSSHDDDIRAFHVDDVLRAGVLLAQGVSCGREKTEVSRSPQVICSTTAPPSVNMSHDNKGKGKKSLWSFYTRSLTDVLYLFLFPGQHDFKKKNEPCKMNRTRTVKNHAFIHLWNHILDAFGLNGAHCTSHNFTVFNTADGHTLNAVIGRSVTEI